MKYLLLTEEQLRAAIADAISDAIDKLHCAGVVHDSLADPRPYAAPMTVGEANWMRSQGFDPDEVLIGEAMARQGHYVLAEDFFADLRRHARAPHPEQPIAQTPSPRDAAL